MILKRLVEYENRHSNQAPVGYANRRVHLKVRLRSDGTLRDAISFSDGTKGKSDGVTMMVPNIKRSGTNPPPFILVDDARYVLGAENSGGYRERFEALVAECAQESGDARVQAVLTWLRSKPALSHPAGEALTRMHVIGFEVEGDWLPDLPAVRNFWARKAGAVTATKGSTPKAVCLVTGEITEPVRILPLKVKGVPKTNQGQADLTSFNNDAFRSYGLDQTQNSPMSAEAARKAVNGLNRLLADEATRLYVGDVVYCFWTREPVEFSVMRWLDNPQPADVKELLAGAFTGRLAEIKETSFCSLALSGYTSRIVVRDYVELTLGKVADRLAAWFRRIAIVDQYGGDPKPYGLYRLAASLFRDAKDIPAHVPTALLRSALTGAPLPDYLLGLAVKRNLAMQGPFYKDNNGRRQVSDARLALIKAILEEKGGIPLTALNTDHPDAAYHCGRLLALLEQIQRSALGDINATVVDRFYGAACASPGTVLGNLVNDAQAHLAKMRKGSGDGWAQNRLGEILSAIGDHFPKTLSLQRRGLFALGFYHQKAHDRAAAAENKAAKLAALGEPA